MLPTSDPFRALPQTLGELRQSSFSEARLAARGVKDELRDNLICKLQKREPLFPGIIGYEDSVVPQMSTQCSPATTSFCSGCADRRRRGSFA